ncbi:MAG: alpha/beta hydrolase fold domain-containing protein [bacterium]|nr:alpha/beta hydrolase fold domain-containing protein [bacterium]
MNDLSDGRVGMIPYRSSNPFEFSHILRGLGDASPQRVFGWLLWPEHAQTPAPAIVACHGSMGWRGHHHEHMVRALEQGIAVFRVHSFEARQVQSIVEDQMAVTAAMLLVDAYGALEKLASHPEIDPTRIGVTGWSLGGTVALYAAHESLREALVGVDGPRFAAHLPLYPAAHVRPEEKRWSPSPIRVLHGAADDYTPVRFVEELAEDVRSGGGHIDIRSYAEAHHSFDSVEPLTWLPDAVRLGRKSLTLAEDGDMYFTSSDGIRHSVAEPEERRGSFEKANIRGAHVGGNWDARRQGFADADGFWKEHLLS